jgi:endonuclease I
MEADLYNMQPAIGEINRLRSNYSMEMIPGDKREFGACDLAGENSGKFVVGSAADTEADARAQMLIYLVENGLWALETRKGV